MEIEWSGEIPFERGRIEKEVPAQPGVYKIIQSEPYQRYVGQTPILKIGMSRTNLKHELLNHFIRHTVANRLARIRNRESLKVSVVFVLLSKDSAIDVEGKLLRDFEDNHWDLPVLNSQRGYGRAEDGHYKY